MSPLAGPNRLTANKASTKGVLGPNVENQMENDIASFFADSDTWARLGYEEDGPDVARPSEQQFPPSIADNLTQERLDSFKRWLLQRIDELKSSHDTKMDELTLFSEAYKARPSYPERTKAPFVGASDDVIPVIAMAVDPIVARLDIGIMKQNPVFSISPIRKSLVDYRECLEKWTQFNQLHRWKLRQVAYPRFFEFANLGTMVFKTVYDRIEAPIKTWERNQTSGRFTEKKKKLVKFTGAKVFGVPVDRFYFPPGYTTVDECPIVAERLTLTYEQLRVAEASGKIIDVNALGHSPTRQTKSAMEDQQEINANHEEPLEYKNEYELFEIWCDYDIDGDGYPESLVVLFEPERRVFLQLTYNWYFHQRKPYTVIPYTIQDGSLYGMGLAEMILPFQNAITRWHQMAQNNAYLANIRMFVAKKNSGIEEVPRLYSGKVFFVDDPSKDFKPFAAADIYPSTLAERQNLFGMVEKRTGVSDYLTGRESPILGSRATATSTIALIAEGTKRVEETLENIRAGFADIIEKAYCIWIQYGTEDLEDLVFGTTNEDDTARKIENFFASISQEQVINGAIGVTLKATDAGDNKQARQQMQLAIITIMMGFFEKQLEAGAAALEAIQAQQPQYAQLVNETLTAARKLFKDLLYTYDIQTPEQYLPDITKFLGLPPESDGPPAPAYGSGAGGALAGLAGATGIPGLATLPGTAGGFGGVGAPGAGVLPTRPPFAPGFNGEASGI